MNQFAIFQELHSRTCSVSGSSCDAEVTIWPFFALYIAVALLFGLYAYTGLAARVGTWAEGRTDRLWLQSLVVVTPPVLAIVAGFAIVGAIAELSDPLAGCTATLKLPDGTSECAHGGYRWLTNALAKLLLIPVVAVACYIALRIIRQSPRRLWLFPFLCAAAFTIHDRSGLDSRIKSKELPAYNTLIPAVSEMTQREGWPLEKIEMGRGQLNRYRDPAVVVGFGPWKRIVFASGYAVSSEEVPDWRDVSDVSGFRRLDPSPAALRALMGHELAHVRRWHPELLLVADLLLLALLTWSAGRVAIALPQARPSVWTKLSALAAAMALAWPLLFGAVRGLTLIAEYDADRIGLDISREPDGFAEIALVFAAGQKLELPLGERWILTTHPSNGERIRMAIDWQLANRPNQPLSIPDPSKLYVHRDGQPPR